MTNEIDPWTGKPYKLSRLERLEKEIKLLEREKAKYKTEWCRNRTQRLIDEMVLLRDKELEKV